MIPWSHPEPDRTQHVAVVTERALRDIDKSSTREDGALAAAFMSVAWPTLQAQNQ
jgi:hypothetical protein